VARVLTAPERASLETLRRFGAVALPDSFTVEELKAAYRQLAFRLHPDQHPEADACARLELGRQFASVHAAYRRLTGR
jgi:DnaJ-class molecular chaperone